MCNILKLLLILAQSFSIYALGFVALWIHNLVPLDSKSVILTLYLSQVYATPIFITFVLSSFVIHLWGDFCLECHSRLKAGLYSMLIVFSITYCYFLSLLCLHLVLNCPISDSALLAILGGTWLYITGGVLVVFCFAIARLVYYIDSGN